METIEIQARNKARAIKAVKDLKCSGYNAELKIRNLEYSFRAARFKDFYFVEVYTLTHCNYEEREKIRHIAYCAY